MPQMAFEIANKLKSIIAQHGPRSVALYLGTYGYLSQTSFAFAVALMAAIKSPMFFTAASIDQPGKIIAMAEHGVWLGGFLSLEDCDVALVIGQNPLIGMQVPFGPNPARALKLARDRGMKLIVIDHMGLQLSIPTGSSFNVVRSSLYAAPEPFLVDMNKKPAAEELWRKLLCAV
jgi:anaerobic selenocysteine-containing dehydrogenase